MKISIIGTGNLGSHLAAALEEAGHTLINIYGRNLAQAQHIASKLYSAEATDNLDFSTSKAELFIIAVSDDAIANIANDIILPEKAILSHTSGTKNIMELVACHNPKGVFYPLQTFTKGKKVDWSTIPICIEATNQAADIALTKVAESLSKFVYFLDALQRKRVHLAAVFACNFTNHLLKTANDLLASHDIPFDILKPLIIETVDKALINGPANSQTGPAVRKDIQTVQQHLEDLAFEPDKQEIYRLLSKSIMGVS
jgi:predicted short-subunit dehydrogenase-like oxidoreductase (DUF2520 family)